MDLCSLLPIGKIFRHLTASNRRRSRRSFHQTVEPCESRCVLTTLGAAPSISILHASPQGVIGVVNNDSTNNDISVKVDINNDGSIEAVIDVSLEPFTQKYIFEYAWPSGQFGFDDVQVVLIPTESSVFESQDGPYQLITIPGQPNRPPVLVHATISENLVAGHITDDALSLGGAYIAEVAFGSESSIYREVDVLESDGTFMAVHNLGYNDGTIPVFIRVREITSHPGLTSNVIRAYYTSSNGGGPPAPGSPGGPGGPGGFSGLGGFSGFFGDDDDHLGLFA